MGAIRNFTTKTAVKLIEYYQKNISHSLNSMANSSCFYKPSCSQYTKEAVLEHGAFKGSIQGLLRLMRCIPEMKLETSVDFLRVLSENDEETINKLIQVNNKDAKDKIALLKSEVLKKPVHSIWDTVSKTTFNLLKAIDIHKIDNIKNTDSEPLFFVHGIENNNAKTGQQLQTTQNSSIVSKMKNSFKNAFHQAGQTVSGIAMGMIGGALGLTIGTSVGTITGGVASLDMVDNVNGYIADKFTPQSADGPVIIEKSCGGPAYMIHHAMSDHKFPHWLASGIAFLPGIVSGGALGIYHGIKFGVKEGWHVGRALGDYGTHNIFS